MPPKLPRLEPLADASALQLLEQVQRHTQWFPTKAFCTVRLERSLLILCKEKRVPQTHWPTLRLLTMLQLKKDTAMAQGCDSDGTVAMVQ